MSSNVAAMKHCPMLCFVLVLVSMVYNVCKHCFPGQRYKCLMLAVLCNCPLSVTGNSKYPGGGKSH